MNKHAKNQRKKKRENNRGENIGLLHEPPLWLPVALDNEAIFDREVGIILPLLAPDVCVDKLEFVCELALAGGSAAHDDWLLVLLLLLVFVCGCWCGWWCSMTELCICLAKIIETEKKIRKLIFWSSFFFCIKN